MYSGDVSWGVHGMHNCKCVRVYSIWAVCSERVIVCAPSNCTLQYTVHSST